MSLGDALHPRFRVPTGIMVVRLVRAVLSVRGSKPEDRLRNDLERIASSAPHLLIDIGFVRDPKVSSPAETIWRNGSVRVAISSQDGSVSVLQR